MNDFLSILYPMLLTMLAGFLGCVGKEVVKLAPQLVSFVVAKIGITNYQKSKLVALDVWNVIEEDKRVGKLVNSKINEFETLIKIKIPSISDTDIKLLRQSIAGEYNKDKPVIIKAIEEPLTAAPILKYFALDGITELQPVKVQ